MGVEAGGPGFVEADVVGGLLEVHAAEVDAGIIEVADPISESSYGFGGCDAGDQSNQVCDYRALVQDVKRPKAADCPECGRPTRPVRRRDGGHCLVCKTDSGRPALAGSAEPVLPGVWQADGPPRAERKEGQLLLGLPRASSVRGPRCVRHDHVAGPTSGLPEKGKVTSSARLANDCACLIHREEGPGAGRRSGRDQGLAPGGEPSAHAGQLYGAGRPM